MVAPGDAILLGHRADDLDPGAATELARLPADLRHIDAGVASRDPAGAGERAAAWLSGAGRGAWLHVDLDARALGAVAGSVGRQPGRLPARPRRHRRAGQQGRGSGGPGASLCRRHRTLMPNGLEMPTPPAESYTRTRNV